MMNKPSVSNLRMSDEDAFHLIIILNVLETWKGSFTDESLMRSLLDRMPDRLNGCDWVSPIKNLEQVWRDAQSDGPTPLINYVPYGKFLSNSDIKQLIIEPFHEAYPQLTQKAVVSKTCQTLASLMDLSELEMQLLNLSFEMKAQIFPWDHIYPKLVACIDRREMTIPIMLGCSLAEAKSALEGFLVKSGFIAPSIYPEGLYVLAPSFEETFDNKNIGVDDVEELLFPNSLTTDLSRDDYQHINTDLNRVEQIISKSIQDDIRGTNIMLWGPAGTGKTELSTVIARENGWKLKSIGDISESDSTEKSRAQRLTSLKIALKLFRNDKKTVLLFDEIEDLFKVDNNATFSKAFINRIIETTPIPIIWTTNCLYAVGTPVLRRMTYNIHCTVPSKTARRTMWEKYAEQYGVGLDQETKTLLDNFDIAPALIRNTMRVTGSVLSGDTANQNDIREIVTSLDRLVNFGSKRKFDIKSDTGNHLYDVSCVNTEHSLEGFTEKLVGAKSYNFALCLYGPAGTGKSQYSRYLAGRLGKSVLFKRASDLMSKWVGETEKKIAEAFEEAATENKMLIIDEGDSFLRNRELSQHSWEISQVNEMLSQMEDHSEPFVLTTNLMGDLDPAAMRRFTFKMKFDYMTPDQARRLFERYYGVGAPSRISKNHLLTPGDIACVLKQVNILGIDDSETIYQMIEAEVALKPDHSRSIGY